MNRVFGRLMLSVAVFIMGVIIINITHEPKSVIGEFIGGLLAYVGLIALVLTLGRFVYQKYVPKMVVKYSSQREEKLAENERKSAEDELLKAKMLFDAGILTQEEFDKKIQKLKQKVL